MLNEKISGLKKILIETSVLAETMLKKSIEGLLTKKEDQLLSVINKDEKEMNIKEIEIDRICINLIARYQPEASNLRIILMIFRINNDLERIGDLCVNIAESSVFLINKPEVKPLIDIPRMAETTALMLKSAITSFIKKDIELAKKVLNRDNIVDALRDQILRELISFMISDPKTIERAIHLIRISRNIERIADLATNICEDVIYMVKGEVIKHKYS